MPVFESPARRCRRHVDGGLIRPANRLTPETLLPSADGENTQTTTAFMNPSATTPTPHPQALNSGPTKTGLSRRHLFLALGGTATGLAGLTTLQAAEHDSHGSSLAERCAKACADSMTSCSKHVRHCTQHLADGHKHYAKCLELCIGCLQMCGACVGTCFGPMGATVAEACAKACDLCAAECERIEGDEAMKVHAKVCRDCAQVCRDFSKARA